MFSTQNNNMVSLELEDTPAPVNTSSPRISFSADFLNDDVNFLSLRTSPAIGIGNGNGNGNGSTETEKERSRNPDFEFLSGDLTGQAMISTADELFFEGKMLPYLQKQSTIGFGGLKEEKEVHVVADQEEKKKRGGGGGGGEEEVKKDQVESRMNNNWFLDEDPSPRPPKCTVLWKELLRLKKQRPPPPSYLSPSSSSSSSSSGSTLGEIDQEKEKEKEKDKERRIKKGGLERTRSATIRIRPMVNVPICTHTKSNSLPPLFSQRSTQAGIRTSTTITARDHHLRHK